MHARLLIQFIAEIILREIRVNLRDSKECQKMTRRLISANIKSIYKIIFNSRHGDVNPELTKSQRDILSALKINDNR
jgi:hypothetical protein